ncbi:LAFE_0D09714g1_1 [Lachancea fermentati]|uniref:SWI5-dependent HO expression protein 3 n=1 Tax=Lachancea fermentati TaxID=4955 RepID=A0A1G4MBM0_LACFM|nr:LAFE_0D09714g1_1 [Lachancea fermentati]
MAESPSNFGTDLGSPVKVSPSKLAMNHGAFLANMNNGDSPTKVPGVGAGSSSTKVIESLHAQIDNLTTTNLQLTVQSNNLLSRLESANTKQSKQLETISTLKHENDNLNAMLARKERRLKEAEQELVQLKSSFESTSLENQNLQQEMKTSCQRENALDQKLQLLQVQYDALADGQKRYRDLYEKEVAELRSNLQVLKKENDIFITKNIRNVVNNSSVLQQKLNQYGSKFKGLESLSNEHMETLSQRVDKFALELDLPRWQELYKETRDMALEYAREMNLKIPQSFTEQHNTKITVESKFKTPDSTPPLASNGGTFAHPQIRIPKVRNSSSNKRSSFYGSSGPIVGTLPSTSSASSPSVNSLPGVKRSSSTRVSSPPSRSFSEFESNGTGTNTAVPSTAAKLSRSSSRKSSAPKKKREPSHSRNRSASVIMGP